MTDLVDDGGFGFFAGICDRRRMLVFARLAATKTLRTPARLPKHRPPTLTWLACSTLAVAAVAAFIAIELSVLHAGFRDYDEGVY